MELPNLPESGHEFWDGEINLHKIGVEPEKHEHLFTYDGDNRHIKCGKCGIGYMIGSQEQLKDGHLYYRGEFMF